MNNLVYSKFVDQAALVLPYTFAKHVDSETPIEVVTKALPAFHVVSSLYNKSILLSDETTYVYVGEDTEDIGYIIYMASALSTGCLAVWSILDPLFPPPEPAPDEISINFWSTRHGSAHKRVRRITTQDWKDIEINYSQPTREAVSRVIELTPKDLEVNGRIILYHGVTGGGKTNVLKSHARAWFKWCNIHYIMDPQNLFNNPEYLLSVVMDESSDDMPIYGEPKAPQKLMNFMIMEDSDKFIQTDAKQEVGQQALSNLLNLSQGLIGQGLGWVILITTNEPIKAINGAILRDMRCLAEIEFGPLTPKEVKVWCDIHHIENVPSGERTLAQLYSLLTTTGGKIVSHVKKESVGAPFRNSF